MFRDLTAVVTHDSEIFVSKMAFSPVEIADEIAYNSALG
jgi:hypothetical protein